MMGKNIFFKVKYYNFGTIRRARMLAADKHAGQYRIERLSNKKLPYIIHTDGVAEYLMAMGMEEEMVIAGHLHDTLEDTDLTEKEILMKFGPRVLKLIKALTEPKGKSWHERKKHKIRVLCYADLDVKILAAADQCENLLSLLEALHQEGLVSVEDFVKAKVWKNFRQGYKSQKWYRQEVCKSIFANVPYDMLHPLFGKLMRLVEMIFGERIIEDPKIRRKVKRRKKLWINPHSFISKRGLKPK